MHIREHLDIRGAKSTLILSSIFVITYIIALVGYIVALVLAQSNILYNIEFSVTDRGFSGIIYRLPRINLLSLIMIIPGFVTPLTGRMYRFLYKGTIYYLFTGIIDIIFWFMLLVLGYGFDIVSIVKGIICVLYFFASGALHVEYEYNL